MLKLSGGERDKRESGAEREPLSLPLPHQCSDVTGVAAFQNLETEKYVWNNSSYS